MIIVAIDLAISKSVACIYNQENGEHKFVTFPTKPQEIHDLMLEYGPDRVVIEICSIAGWVYDLITSMDIEVQVANPTNAAWKWKNVKRKTDRDDALKLAQLSAMNQLPVVYMADRDVRAWRKFINYRSSVVGRSTVIKNSIRSILAAECIKLSVGKCGWTQKSLRKLDSMAISPEQLGPEPLWKCQLWLELRALADVGKLLEQITSKLDEMAAKNEKVKLLQSIPGVGPRLAEVVVAYIDKAERFDNGKQVGCYAGLTPRQFQSGDMDRRGRISKKGNGLLRKMLISVSWLVLRYNDYFREIYNRVSGPGHRDRKKGIVAVARRLLVCCWAMLRDGSRWRVPATCAGGK
jgi:transposase